MKISCQQEVMRIKNSRGILLISCRHHLITIVSLISAQVLTLCRANSFDHGNDLLHTNMSERMYREIFLTPVIRSLFRKKKYGPGSLFVSNGLYHFKLLFLTIIR